MVQVKMKLEDVSKNIARFVVEQNGADLEEAGAPDYGQCHVSIGDPEALEHLRQDTGKSFTVSFAADGAAAPVETQP